jgi:DNA repair protein RadC
MTEKSKLGHRQRVKDKIKKSGLIGMAEYEILEYMLFSLFPVKDTKNIAKKLLKEFKTLENLLQAPKNKVLKVDGVGEAVYIHLKFTKELTEYLYTREVKDRDILNSVEKVYKYLQSEIGFLEKEVFKIIFLNSKNEFLGEEILFLGTIDKSQIYAREIIKETIKYNAKSVIFAHNHPSGSFDPSRADIEMTKKLKNILEPLEVRVLDHIIITSKGYYSFLEEGII